MMTCKEIGGQTLVVGTGYTVEFIPGKLLAVLRLTPSFYYGMSLLSAIDTMDECDASQTPPTIAVVSSTPSTVTIRLDADSSVWEKKTHYYAFREKEIEYWTEIDGKGRIDRAYFFRGTIEGNEVASVPGFTQVFSPMPNFIEKQEFHASEYTAIAAGNYKEIIETIRGFGLHGAPLCFVFHEGDTSPFLSVGVLARPGQYNFHAFEINHLSRTACRAPEPIIGTQALSLAYHGHQSVDGHWETPHLVLRFADSRMAAVGDYVRKLEEYGGVIRRTRSYEPWTFQPIYCTWHDQVAIAKKGSRRTNLSFKEMESGNAYFDSCTQANCLKWLGLLEEHGILPGSFIIDAKWQVLNSDPAADTTKFPDLRGMIDRFHEKNVKVILWFNGWDREGLPDEECLLVDGKPVQADPTNPAYRRRVAEFMRRMLSNATGCYDADGLKVDGMTNTPAGAALRTHGGVAGFELARCLLDLLYAEGKKAKPESILGQFTAFPYFADLCDFARTGDLYTIKGDPLSANKFRADIQRIVMPDIAVDTDGAQRFNYIQKFEDMLLGTPVAGVPCIYQAEWLMQARDFCVPAIRPLQADEYESIKRHWEHYRDNCRQLKE
ncbi:MAG: hypothetical protein WCS96_10795 [Victivallales bacterium]